MTEISYTGIIEIGLAHSDANKIMSILSHSPISAEYKTGVVCMGNKVKHYPIEDSIKYLETKRHLTYIGDFLEVLNGMDITGLAC